MNELLVAYCLITLRQTIIVPVSEIHTLSRGDKSPILYSANFWFVYVHKMKKSNYSVDIVNADENILFEPSGQFCEVFLILCRIWLSNVTNAACEINLDNENKPINLYNTYLHSLQQIFKQKRL